MLYGMPVWPDKIWSEHNLSVSSDKLLEASNQYVTCLHPDHAEIPSIGTCMIAMVRRSLGQRAKQGHAA